MVTITILPGINKEGMKECFERIDIGPGDVISIVGPTGSGKTALLNDIEVFANDDTVTRRTILVDGKLPDEKMVRDPSMKPIAMITQNTKCLADLSVWEFLNAHRLTRKNLDENIIERTIALGNEFTGEKFDGKWRISELSGGQTRSLMIADALLISNAPLILLDEVENAGIYKKKVIDSLKTMKKAVIFVTHDPFVSMIAERRIVMRNGEVSRIISPDGSESGMIRFVEEMDSKMSKIRELIRDGNVLTGEVV